MVAIAGNLNEYNCKYPIKSGHERKTAGKYNDDFKNRP
jgi:hypothetical protein